MRYVVANLRWKSEKNLFFLHNQRCAGTSFNWLLTEYFHESLLKLGRPLGVMATLDSVPSSQEQMDLDGLREAIGGRVEAKRSFVAAGHFDINTIDSVSGGKFVGSNFRDPVDRHISCVLAFGGSVFNDPYYLHMYVSNFTGKRFTPAAPPGQEDVDTAIERVRQLDGLIGQARFSESLIAVEQALGIGSLISLLGGERSPRSPKFSGRARISDADREKLRKRMAADYQVFEEIVCSFDERLKRTRYSEDEVRVREWIDYAFNFQAWKKHAQLLNLSDLHRLNHDDIVRVVSAMTYEAFTRRPDALALADTLRERVAALSIYAPDFLRAVDDGIENGIRNRLRSSGLPEQLRGGAKV